MKVAKHFAFLAGGIVALCLAGCSSVKITHVPPGHSARAALADREAAAKSPTELPTDANAATAAAPIAGAPAQEALPTLATSTAGMPKQNDVADKVSDAYTRGSFAMQAGQNAEAIAAFEEAVKLDTDFTDAWGKLAILYQKGGQSAKATEAFRKAKRLGDANGGTVTRDAAGGLQFP